MINIKLKDLSLLVIMFALAPLGSASYADTLTLTVSPQNSTVTLNPATIALNGMLYANSIWLEDVTAGTTQAAADETFIARVVAKNQTGTQTDVLNTWNPDEQAKMGTYINDTNLFAANQAFYKTIKNSAFLAKVSYGEYIVFLVQHTMQDATNISKMYPIKLVNGVYYMTNLLSNDPIYVYYMPNISKLISFKTKPQ
jgi:hypothetical protein